MADAKIANALDKMEATSDTRIMVCERDIEDRSKMIAYVINVATG